ncbi:MAG TPA: hypothetical protein VIG30_08025 [Ktedonobacterales bacterium]|jgi:hypothetical protein
MAEYTLVFRRALTTDPHREDRGPVRRWYVARPAGLDTVPGLGSDLGAPESLARVFVVPICSALGLDGVAYEHFLNESGVLRAACAYLGRASLARPEAVETARRQVQALVMAAEVQHIVDRMSA